MTVSLIELLLGIYFVGISISITKTKPSPSFNTTMDIFKFIFGIVLIVAAIYQGVKLA